MIKIFQKYKSLLLLLLFPINSAFLEIEIKEEDVLPEETKENVFMKYLPIILVISALLLFYYNPFSTTDILDPYDMTINYTYPNDGQIRPPQNPPTVALRDYFVIPDKPYFVNGVRNFLLLDKDMLEYINTEQIRPIGMSIPPFIVKWLEICYGYDITQEFFMNLEYHRKLTLPNYGIGNIMPYVPMEFVFNFVKWYYRKGDDYRPLYSLWFSPELLLYMEGKDFYDLRIFPHIYTRAKEWPSI